MSFEPFRSVVLSSRHPEQAPVHQAKTVAIPKETAASTTVERPSIGGNHPTTPHCDRPESLHHVDTASTVEEIVRPPSTVLTKEWVFAQTEAEVASALGNPEPGPREATISPPRIPEQRPVPPAPAVPRQETVSAVPHLSMDPLPARPVRETETEAVASLHGAGTVSAATPASSTPASSTPASSTPAPKPAAVQQQFVVSYDGHLIGTYESVLPIRNRQAYQNVAEQLVDQIDGFDASKIRLFQLGAVPISDAIDGRVVSSDRREMHENGVPTTA